MAWELVRSGHLVRSVRLAPFLSGAAAVAVFLAARRGGTHDVIGDLRVLGLLLALGSGYVLDDGAAVTLQASPYSLARRIWLRIGFAAAVVVPSWTVILARYLPSAPADDRWALGVGLTVELAAALTVIWAVAAWGRRHGFEHPGVITTPALLAGLLLATSIPQAPMLIAYGAQWTPAHLRWSGVLVIAFCVLMAAMRDPASVWKRSSASSFATWRIWRS
ncbi:hypothetical protein ACFOY4_22365 [Actinomadura syzygii]|uniref:Uncharacterized protein n=1 Tax=Actinomadura syzygii TaxID=1427538 RepID=A0A5D0TVI6_9ACTN|nr:hypothetical protein [Actinomadura syzygii]TYC09754.1 hypothetical protein FXF65_31995 [Actinomadura syzygii]